MSNKHIKRLKRLTKSTTKAAAMLLLLYSCASIGRPEGGPIDETPPHFVSGLPAPGALNSTRTKIAIEFDEFVKLEGANEKIIISPPQVQRPEIKSVGKKVTIGLLDTLKKNTTYTIDFADAILDNNEGNPLGNFTYTFSTGGTIDTMVVAGTVLRASDLEPVKGMLVGLHSNPADSAFTTRPLERVGRTDSRGHFSIRGIAPGSYRLYGLTDTDQNFTFTQKTEAIAFYDSLVVPRFEERLRQDTLRKDSITIDTILTRKYTHFLPDKLILHSFIENYVVPYPVKGERPARHKFSLYFTEKSDTLPTLKGLNFDAHDAFIVERPLQKDTLHYWVKDSLIYRQDTLQLSVTYPYVDSLNIPISRTDTLQLATKKQKPTQEEPKKKKKKGKKEEEPLIPPPTLSVKVQAPSPMDVYNHIALTFEEPLHSFDTLSIHLRLKADTLKKEIPFRFEKDSVELRTYRLYCDWEPKEEYELTVDSAAFVGIYGLHTAKLTQTVKVKSLDDYGAIYFSVPQAHTPAFAELLDAQDKPLRKAPVIDGKIDFLFLDPGKYCARLIEDTNGNGIWDTGNYADKRQPEQVYYYPQILEVKALLEYEQDWNIRSTERDKQKPNELKKQKPDEDKKKKKQAARQSTQQSTQRSQRR